MCGCGDGVLGGEELEEGRVRGPGTNAKLRSRGGQAKGFVFSASGNAWGEGREDNEEPMMDFKLRNNTICFFKKCAVSFFKHKVMPP